MAAICVNVAAAAVTGPKASALQGGAGATAAAATTTTTTTTTRTKPSRNGVHASHFSCSSSSSSSTFAAPGFCNIARRRTPAIRHSSSVRTHSQPSPVLLISIVIAMTDLVVFCAFLQEMLLFVHDCKQNPKAKNKRGDSVLSHKCITKHKRTGKDKTERNKSERKRQRQRQRFLLDLVKSVPCGR
jgi:hypothetical protein